AAASLKFDTFVDFQVCGSAIECYRDHLLVDGHFVKILTLKEPPSRSFAHMLARLHDMPSNLIIASEWRPQSSVAVRRLIESKRRHFHNSKKSFLNYGGTSSAPVNDTLVD